MQSPLVSPDWLNNQLQNPNLIVLDASVEKAITGEPLDPQRKFISGAIKFDLENVFSDLSSSQPNTIPQIKEFTEQVGDLGINNDSVVVIYDSRGMYSSPRAWWIFRTMGHKQVYVLDGGLEAWLQHDYPIQAELSAAMGGESYCADFQTDKLRSAKQVLKSTSDQQVAIIDVRSAARFAGTAPEPREGLRSGRIPSSFNLPYANVLQDGAFLPEKELRKVFADHGIEPKQQAVFSCGSGMTACIVMLAAELIGWQNLSVYDGSWTEWGMDAELPIETANS